MATGCTRGMMLDPTMRNIEKFLEDTQVTVTGKVFVTLMPHRFIVSGIESEHDLMNNKIWLIRRNEQ